MRTIGDSPPPPASVPAGQAFSGEAPGPPSLPDERRRQARVTTAALGPRVVVAGTHSGVGKTTVATGLLAALASKGTKVASAKIGPDFIDPGYHTLATGRPGINLDSWISGEWALPALAARAGAGAELLLIEGVMGLFDGATWGWDRPSADGGANQPVPASTASVAKLLGAPVLLVVDASSMSHSVAALVSGYAHFADGVQIGGVICNRVGSDSHRRLLGDALQPLGLPVLGYIPRDDALVWRDRHLGLVPVVEDPSTARSALDRLSALLSRWCDLDAIAKLARSAPRMEIADSLPRTRTSGSARIAVASGKAFSFVYPDNLARLEQAGAELLPFDPLTDESLPPGVGGLYAGGGFPEVYAGELAANGPMVASVRSAWSQGLAVWAECGGLLWLSQSLDGTPMAGVVPAVSAMTADLTVGYRRATARTASPLGPAGTVLRGHEFHMSTTTPGGTAFGVESRTGTFEAGFAGPRLVASYLHLHLGSDPLPAERFVATADAVATAAGGPPRSGAGGLPRSGAGGPPRSVHQ
ncbi:MAG: cobyrinate a,c-diamide synthase [Actinomycetota bacterium]|nr:cobyrinate a,c-diamide synthase [Actinomycetota bacterium]